MLPRYIIRIGFTLLVLFLTFVVNDNSQAGILIAGDTFTKSVYDLDQVTGERGNVISNPYTAPGFDLSSGQIIPDSDGISGLAFNHMDGYLYATIRLPGSSVSPITDLIRSKPDIDLLSVPIDDGRNGPVTRPLVFERVMTLPNEFHGLTFDSNRNRLIASNYLTNEVHQIDIEANELNLLTSFPRGEGFGGIAGLAFDAKQDLIYAVDDSLLEGTQLLVIDPETGLVSIAGEDDELIRLADGTMPGDIDSLAYDSDLSVLWAINDGLFGGSTNRLGQQLLMIDPLTKIATPVGEPMTTRRIGYIFQGLAIITPEPSVATLLLTGIAMASVRRRRA